MSTELIDVKMPDGTIISGIPKGTSQSEVMRRYSLSQRPAAGSLNPIPEGLQPDKETLTEKAKRLFDIVMNTAPGADTGNAPTSIPGLDTVRNAFAGGIPGSAATAAMTAGQAVKASPLVQSIKSLVNIPSQLIPSESRASRSFQTVAPQANPIPINTSDAQLAFERAQQIEKFGGQAMPKPLADFSNLTRPGTVVIPKSPIPIAVEPPALTYEGGRQLASNTGDLLGSGELKPQMKAAVGQFYDAMKTANRGAAEQVGMGDLYDNAMKEYRAAKNLQEAGAVIKKWGIRAAIAAAGAPIVLKAGKELLGF